MSELRTTAAAIERLLAAPPVLHTTREGEPAAMKLADEVLRFIAERIDESSGTLETGSGFSTIVFAICGTQHTCITPSENEVARIQAYCAANEIALDKVQFLIGRSETVLPSLHLEDLDLVLIDGSHAFPITFIDWFYSSSALREGGCLIVDDIHVWTGAVLTGFLRADPDWRFDRYLGLSAAFTRLATTVLTDWDVQPYVAARSSLFAFLRTEFRALGPIRFGSKLLKGVATNRGLLLGWLRHWPPHPRIE